MALSATRPAASEQVQTVRLTSARYAGSSWSPPGMSYAIKFDGGGNGFVSESHFDEFIGWERAASMNMTVKRMTAGTMTTRRVANDQSA
jgi:hypothetical protein